MILLDQINFIHLTFSLKLLGYKPYFLASGFLPSKLVSGFRCLYFLPIGKNVFGFKLAKMTYHTIKNNKFYEKVPKDDLLQDIFNKKIQERWPEHLEKMCRFWQTVLMEEHTYFGSPFVQLFFDSRDD